MTDNYQRRYEEHRRRKVETLSSNESWKAKWVSTRRSVRNFTPESIPSLFLNSILETARQAPQSCNRQALTIKVTQENRIGELLAGGEGWLEKVPVILLIFADLTAYKSPVERDFMPWLDAGVMMATLVYAATAHGIGSCIVNPHIRPENIEKFNMQFKNKRHLFCGAVALGYAAHIPECPEKKPLEELVEWL